MNFPELGWYDYGAYALALVLLISVLQRIRVGSPNRPLLVGNAAMIVVALLSTGPVYAFVDVRLGDDNYTNLLSHLAMIVVASVVVFGVSNALSVRWVGRGRGFRYVVTVVSVCITAGAFFALHPVDGPIKGYQGHAAFAVYWVGTLLPMLVTAPWLLPAMVRAVGRYGRSELTSLARISLVWFALGFVLVTVGAVVFVAAYFAPQLGALRDVATLATTFALVAGFITATAALPRSSRTRTRPQSRA